ncbi:MAG: glutathione peroxidase [Flavobacteriales bacterium]|nr:glutathione peroxidase [Flavobacteriales bacterium]|tara:strand:+ start:10254 stop:10769 length:516 start_codon:yes stop_codon:yes gene_type:complete
MKIILVALLSLLVSGVSVQEIQLQTLSGETLSLSKFKGKKILIVNTASYCGYTGQYAELQKLYERFKDKLEIVGMPCNQFMMQEPGSNEKIAAFCKKNYGVSFTMLVKADVKGKNQHPLYKWLTSKSENGVLDATVSWNFNKFLLDEEGKMIAHFESGVKPLSDEIVSKIK